MSTITLVRHGQAQTGARDEHGYDQLSDLGHQQARWLGEHLDTSGEHFERVYCGTLIRHRETAQSMGKGEGITADPRLNELEFFTMATLLSEQHGEDVPEDREGFVTYMPRLLNAWKDGRIEGVPESFDHFEARVRDAMADIGAGRGPALVVTSGGLIGMVVRQVMGLDMENFARTCIAIMNSSVHRVHPIGPSLALTQFNAIPHLDRADRQFAQTHL